MNINYLQDNRAKYTHIYPEKYSFLSNFFRFLVEMLQVGLSHNHPSGNLQPSEADKGLTKNIREAGKVLDIPVLDHLIITSETYLSFADEGLL